MKRPGIPGIVGLMVLGWLGGVAAVALAADVPLPQSLTGGGGSTWLIANCPVTPGPRFCVNDATLLQTAQDDAFDTGMTILVDGVPYPAQAITALPVVDLTGTRVTARPVLLSNLNVTVQYYVAPGSPTLRTFVRLTNPPTGTVVSATVSLETNVGSDSATQIFTSSSGDAAFTRADRWVITDDSPFRTDPANTHVLFGPGRSLRPSAVATTVGFSSSGVQGIRADFPLVVPPGVTLSLLFFNQIHPLARDAETRAQATFDDPTQPAFIGLLAGLSAIDRATIVNWDLGFIPDLVQPGDINADGDVTAADAQLLLEVLVGLTRDTAVNVATAGDVNADEVIDNLDAVLILAMSSGRIAPPPDLTWLDLQQNGDGTITITGRSGAVPGGSIVRLRNLTTGAPAVSVTAATDGSFRLTLDAVPGDRVAIDVNGSPVSFSGVVPADPPPFFSNIAAVPDPAQVDEVLTITFTTSERLSGTPTVTVGGNPAAFVSFDVELLQYTFTYTVQGTDGPGPVPIALTGTDVAGNTGVGGGSVQLNAGGASNTMARTRPTASPTVAPMRLRRTARVTSLSTRAHPSQVSALLADDTATPLSQSVPAGPSAIAVEGDGQVVIANPLRQAVFRLTPGNGAARVVSDTTRGSGPQLVEPVGIAVETTGDLLVLDVSLAAVLRIDPKTGNRTLLAAAGPGPCGLLGKPQGMALAADGTLVVTDTAANTGIPGGPFAAVLRLDPESGNCTVLSDVVTGTGPALLEPAGIAVSTNGTLLVVDRAYPAVLTVVPSSPGSGNRALLSGPFVGTGPRFIGPSGIAVTPGSAVLVVDAVLRAVVQVHGNGNRRVLVDNTTGRGPLFTNPVALAVDASALLVGDGDSAGVLRVDPSSGARVRIAP